MKKLFSLFLALALSVGTLLAIDNPIAVGDYYYLFDSQTSSATVARPYNNRSSIVTVKLPRTVIYNGKTYFIKSIGKQAFANCTNLKSVFISVYVESIKESAFEGCTSLTTVEYDMDGYNLTNIGESAFANCVGLTSITTHGSIEANAFSGCTGLTSLTVVEASSVDVTAFTGCDSLKTVTINSNTLVFSKNQWSTTLEDMFGKQVTSYIVGDNVAFIGNQAFYNCTGVTSITIGNKVTSIASTAFYGCSSLTSIIMKDGNQTYDSRDNCNAIIETASSTLIAGCKNTIIPNSVVCIKDSAFLGCSGLISVAIPNSVISIGKSAFYGCKGLTSATIGNSVTSIGDFSFYNCVGLTSVTIPNSVTSIGGDAFSGCTGLTSVTIGNSVTSIGGGAFSDCSGLTSVIIPNSVTSVGAYAFYRCTGLTSATIGNSVTNINSATFHSCSSLTSLTIGKSVNKIYKFAFYGCTSLSSVTCFATTPPIHYGSSGNAEGYNGQWGGGVPCSTIPLYVPVESVDAYKAAKYWKDFGSILPISARDTETTDVKTTTTENSVDVTWPFVAGADTYELVIKDKDGKIVCTLIFNAQGQLISIAYNAPSRNGAPQKTQKAGFSFTVTGLEPGTEYDLTITAKNEAGQELDKKNVTFHTNWLNGIEDIHVDSDKPVKVLMDGQIYILRGNHIFDTQGKMIK